jgi:hypothetical protein
MKQITVFLVFSLLFLQNVKSQDSLKPKVAETPHTIYIVRLNFTTDESLRDHMMAIKDSSVFMYQKKSASPDPLHKGKALMNVESNWDRYNYKIIKSIKVNNKPLRTWSIVSGTVIGMVAGVLIGKNASNGTGYVGSVNSAGAIALGLLLGGGAGAITGLVVASSFEKKYMINGDWKSLEELKATLKY